MSAGEPDDDIPVLNGAASATPQELRLDLPAVHSAARMARHLVRQFARAGGLTGPELDNLVLVADELLSNAVDHGGGEAAMDETDLRKDVRMRLVLTVVREGWDLEVGDEGGGDPQELQEVMAQRDLPDLDDERGRGFYLLARMVDSLEVEKTSDGRGLLFRAVRRYGS